MRETFRILNSQNVNSYLQISLWRNFLIAFAEDIIDEEQDNQIRRKVKRRIATLQQRIDHIHSSQTTHVVQDNDNNKKDAEDIWVKKTDKDFSYKVKTQWHETHSHTQREQLYTYRIDRHNIIVFNAFFDGEPLGVNQVVLVAEQNIFKEYSDYVPTANSNVEINGNVGKYVQYQLTNRDGDRYSAMAYYFVESSKVYISYAVFSENSQHIAVLKESLRSLHFEKIPIVPHGKKWLTVDYPQQNFSYKIPSSWKLHSATNTPIQHIDYCTPNPLAATYIFTSKFSKNFLWEQNIGIMLKWIEPYEIVARKKYNLNGLSAQKNLYKAHVKAVPLAPQFIELIHGTVNDRGFLIYSIYPSRLAKSEVQKIRTVMDTLKLNTAKKQKSFFTTVHEESFPISYKVPENYQCYTEENSIHTVYRIYEGDTSQFSFYISRDKTAVDDLIENTEKSLRSFPGKLTEKSQKQAVFGNVVGKNKTYVYDGFDSRRRHLSYFFAKNQHFTCVFGFWSRDPYNEDYRQIRQSLLCHLDKNAQHQHYSTVIKNNNSGIAAYNRSLTTIGTPLKDLGKAIRQNFIFPEAFLARATIFRQRKNRYRAAKDYQIFLHLQKHHPSHISPPQDIDKYIKNNLPKTYIQQTPLLNIFLAKERLGICKFKTLRQRKSQKTQWQMLDITYHYTARNGKSEGEDRRIFFADLSGKIHEMLPRGLTLEDSESILIDDKQLEKQAIQYYNNKGVYAKDYTIKQIKKIRGKRISVVEITTKYTFIPREKNNIDYTTKKQRFAIVKLPSKDHVFKMIK